MLLLPHIWEAFLNALFEALGIPLWPLAALATGAYDALKDMFKDFKDQLDPFKEISRWAKSYYDDLVPSEMERIRKDIEQLYKEVETFGKEVVTDITKTVGQGLSDGTIDPQTDGDLGKTRDIYTPDGQVPMDVGTMPGMSSPGGGIDRSGGGGGGGGGGTSGSSSGGSTPQGSGSGTSTGSSTGSGTQAPTAGDVGAGPDDFVEYQPNQNQVVITHPDGTQTVKPWP